MLNKITPQVLARITNHVFRENAQIYLDIEANYLQQIESFGLALAQANDAVATMADAAGAAGAADAAGATDVADETGRSKFSLADPDNPKIISLANKGLVVANDAKSLRLNWVSPACLACQKGINSLTFTISMRCTRSCFFCFNPNQDNYERLQHELNDPVAELTELHRRGAPLTDIALTGGEPLVHKDETEAFFCAAKQLFPQAYTRLYTSGAGLDEHYLARLKAAGLQEIRFSLKTDDPPNVLQKTLERIGAARKHLKHVMVEMPVLPDELVQMQDLLIELDAIGIDGINLLELCFPFNNADEFRRRGYKLKAEQFRVLYNYWYAGGLPIAESEAICLELLEFSIQHDLKMGVHYCSLENKFTGQIYQQNAPAQHEYPYCVFSKRDYFLKSAKVFGSDTDKVLKTLIKQGHKKYRHDAKAKVLEFLPSYLESLALAHPDVETAISYHVVEQDDRGAALRELRLDLTTPSTFEAAKDL